jgi:hypothetical protein
MGKDRPTQTVRPESLEMIDAERNRLEHATSGVRHEIVIHIDYGLTARCTTAKSTGLGGSNPPAPAGGRSNRRSHRSRR